MGRTCADNCYCLSLRYEQLPSEVLEEDNAPLIRGDYVQKESWEEEFLASKRKIDEVGC